MKKNAGALLVILLAVLSSSAFLFQVPGYHFDEAWIAELASRIAFEPGFWPSFGMNSYTVPVFSYLQAGLFRVLGYPSLEATRVLYAVLNACSLFLFFQWLKKDRPQASWVFTLLWATFPLSVFNLRLSLEVTSGFAFFASVACYGISEGCIRQQNRVWFWMATLALVLGSLSHLLFFSFVLSLIWAALQMNPLVFDSPALRRMLSLVLLPLTLFFTAPLLQSAIGSGERVKAGLVILMNLFLLAFAHLRWGSRPGMVKLIRFSRWVIYPVASAGVFIFVLFELSGVWPMSQSTGIIFPLLMFPGLLLTGGIFLLSMDWRKAHPIHHFFRALFLALTAFVVANAYKPTSAKYWELPLLAFLLLAALWVVECAAKKKWVMPLVWVCSGLHFILIFQYYLLQTVHHGATAQPYRWLWVKDSALYYRPIIPIYQTLLEMDHLCAQDQIHVDEERNEFVLRVYRSLSHRQGAERDCDPQRAGRHYWVGRNEWVESQKNAEPYLKREAWGDFIVGRSGVGQLLK